MQKRVDGPAENAVSRGMQLRSNHIFSSCPIQWFRLEEHFAFKTPNHSTTTALTNQIHREGLGQLLPQPVV